MKISTFKSALFLFLSMMVSTPFVSAQIGPVVGISETKQALPYEIKLFLNIYFPAVPTANIQLKTLEQIYEIELNNGYELKFQSSGEWIEIEAPDEVTLPERMLSTLLPSSSYRYLKDKRALHTVENLNFDPLKGYKVELSNDKSYYFDLKGKKTRKSRRETLTLLHAN